MQQLDTLTCGLVQYSPVWEDAKSTSNKLNSLLEKVDTADILLLPEMCMTGYSMANLQSQWQYSLDWMQQTAARYNCLVIGSLPAEENGCQFNRCYVVDGSGIVQYYDKHHLFTMGEEKKHYTAGQQGICFDYKGWRIKLIVCYDLRFPEWCRNNKHQPYDLLLCVASWPTSRSLVWKRLLQARAIENQCYCAGVNRVGEDGNGLRHSGDSRIYGPTGSKLAEATAFEEEIVLSSISLPSLHKLRKSFPVLEDMD